MTRSILAILAVLLALVCSATTVAGQVLDTQYVTAQGSDCTTAGACATFGNLPTGIVSISLSVSGTFSGTLTFEGTSDGVNWSSVQVITASTGANSTTTTATGIYAIQNSGFVAVRARGSSWASGSARISATRGWASARLLTPTFTGNVIFSPDNTFDIGASGATRPRTLYLGTSVVVGNDGSSGPQIAGGTTPTTGFAFTGGVTDLWTSGVRYIRFRDNTDTIRLGASATVGWSSNGDPAGAVADTVLARAAAGKVALTGTTPMLLLGGTTASFTAWKNSTTTLQARLADDSADAPVTASTVSPSSPAITIGAGTGITVNNVGEIRHLVYKVTIDKSALICNAVTCDVTIATLPAKTFVTHALADLTTTFACASVCTTATLSAVLGKTAGGTQYLLSFDADAATAQFGDAAAELGASLAPATTPTESGDLASWSATTAVVMRFTSGTGNIGTGAATNLSQGSVTFYITTIKYP